MAAGREPAIAQVKNVMRRLYQAGSTGRGAPLFIFDAGYSAAALTDGLAGCPAHILVRLAAGSVLYADAVTWDGKNGRPAHRGPAVHCPEPADFAADTGQGPRGRKKPLSPNPEPDEELTLPGTPRYGTVRAEAWHDVHPLVHGDRGWFAGRERLPVLRGTLVHVTSSGSPRAGPAPAGLGASGTTGCGAPPVRIARSLAQAARMSPAVTPTPWCARTVRVASTVSCSRRSAAQERLPALLRHPLRGLGGRHGPLGGGEPAAGRDVRDGCAAVVRQGAQEDQRGGRDAQRRAVLGRAAQRSLREQARDDGRDEDGQATGRAPGGRHGVARRRAGTRATPTPHATMARVGRPRPAARRA